MDRPIMTVTKYIPNEPTISENDSMLIILAAIKKNTPIGDNLVWF